MSVIELIPLDKGNRLILDETTVTTIGRTPNIGCLDKKISRNHAELYIKSDGTLWIKPIHNNPTFYKTKTHQLITLTKDQEFQLNDNDEIGLLPNEYFYRISIQSKDREEEEAEGRTDLSTIPKSPIQENESSSIENHDEEKDASPIQNHDEDKESSPIEDHDEEKSSFKDPRTEPEGGIILHTTRELPTWMANRLMPEPKNSRGRGKGKAATTPTKPTPSPSKYRTYIGRKKAEGIVYEDDEESNEESAVPTEHNGHTPSIVVDPAKRERCPYGKFCYRKNPAHRKEAIHPGDPDWNDKENDTDEKKPECPYGNDCYRKNPEHLKEYTHTRKRKSKRKGSNDENEEDDDDDGLPNEYDYSDSFIDDENLDDSARIDRKGDSQIHPDNDWKPHKKARHSDDDDDENNSTDESELNLLKSEAGEFLQGSSINHQRRPKKKARVYIPDDDD